ncbi:kinesin-like protein KIF21A isoform X2 [Centruroides vittatus]|uniref:kinesin-like protein KIF21A isoform X2 n=1 Tax=Centruroides vittatus TaxID=120091 RepID=UPI00350F94F6
MSTDTCVRVAVRIRPQIAHEVNICRICTTVTPGEPQILLGKDKAFTFDHVFDMHTVQESVYDTCVKDLVEGCFEGYNATVFAYGQTGSGKTYTMGTGFDVNVMPEEIGIIPRAMQHLFDGIKQKQEEAKEKGMIPPEFKINAQFMELYNEEILDLLDAARDPEQKGKKSHIKIHEDATGGIYTVGVITQPVTSVEETRRCLRMGALSRTTASTQMNSQSSRSHAIFTLHIKQQRIIKIQTNENDEQVKDNMMEEFETLTAKFHFVDLAGSERLKRTGATGDRAKEGISINCGLLALGNVISALGDRSQKVTHVPYRDSKLTRLLQDSLGGNSHTLMIACISPSDHDFMETLNTLKYANRAKNIKNKAIINQDKSSQMMMMLRQEIQQLKLELVEYKQGKRIVGEDGTEQINDMFHENTMLQAENNNLRTRIKALQETIERLTARNTELLAEKASGQWIEPGNTNSKSEITQMIQGYLKEIEELRAKLMESEETCSQLRKQSQRPKTLFPLSPHAATVAVSGQYAITPYTDGNVDDVLMEAKTEVQKLIECSKSLKEKSEEEENDDKLEENEEKEIKENDDDSSSESEAEETEKYTEDLAKLTCEISIKQKLIEELELSQQRLQTLRQNYEEKLIQLQMKIRETEIERDKVLDNLKKSTETNMKDKVLKVKSDYERKLGSMQSELKKLQAAKKEHAQLMRNQSQYEQQVKQLRQEVLDMKKMKVQLLNKMKEESQRHKLAEQQRVREIAKLKKESRVKEHQLKSLESEKRLKEQILKRKHEEVMALRRMAKPMSDAVAGRVDRRRFAGMNRSLPFSPKVAKNKWQNLEKSINKLVMSKQSVYNIEKDMERWLQERDKLSIKLEKLKKKKYQAVKENKAEILIKDIEDQIETLKANIEYLQENISESQSSIVQIEESKDDSDLLDVDSLLSRSQPEEMRYILEKALNMAVNQSFQIMQKEMNVKELEAKLKQVSDDNNLQQKLLHHALHQTNDDTYVLIMGDDDQDIDSGSVSPVNSAALDVVSITSEGKPDKARRRTATPEELLYGGSQTIAERQVTTITEDVQENNDDETYSLPTPTIPSHGMTRVTSAPSSLRKKMQDKMLPPEISPGARRRELNFNFLPYSRQSSTEYDSSPPSSPPPSRRQIRDDNVFSRLTSGTTRRMSRYEKGAIIPYTGKPSYNKTSFLVCTHIAEGHNKPVLSVTATDDVLFSSSKDRTVKIWDLHTGQEIQTLNKHPNNVTAVRYCEYTRLAFSISTAYVKVWDVRVDPSKCIKTLCSSGLTNNGPMVMNTPSRVIQLPTGETQINDIALNQYGTTLFSAASNIVRIWDLRKFQSVGKLSGGHQAAVMCLAVEEHGIDNNLIVTGSKDHYIKIFEVAEGEGGIHSPKVNLVPPHYDGIQSLAISGKYLFSGSRDMCIKKWDVFEQCLVQSLNQAHKNWICALNLLPSKSMLLSGCRGGQLKSWSSESCQLLDEIKAHNAPINSIATNSTSIFTASNDHTVKIWRFRSNFDMSPDLIDQIED